MSLSSVEWRYVGYEVVSSVTIDIIMDKIYDLSQRSTYQDGTTRTIGQGSAGTWNRYRNSGTTEAVYVTPNVGSQAIIVAGSSSTPSPSPTMLSPDLYYVNKLYVNIVKNPGAFSSWNASSPFTSGSSMGYCSILGSRITSTNGIGSFSGSIYLYESKESIAVFLVSYTGSVSSSSSNGFIGGAIIDPESSDLSDAESDGRVYGLITSGHFGGAVYWDSTNSTNTIWCQTQFSNATAPSYNIFLMGNSTNNGASHANVFLPGTSTVVPMECMSVLSSTGSSFGSSSLRTKGGSFVKMPLIYKGQGVSNQYTIGRLREIFYTRDGVIGQKHTNGSSTVGYVVSCSDQSSSPGDALLLQY